MKTESTAMPNTPEAPFRQAPAAFPQSYPNHGDDRTYELGMDLRDYFAAAALQGALAYSGLNPMTGNYHENCTPHEAARAAYIWADAMLAERNR